MSIINITRRSLISLLGVTAIIAKPASEQRFFINRTFTGKHSGAIFELRNGDYFSNCVFDGLAMKVPINPENIHFCNCLVRPELTFLL